MGDLEIKTEKQYKDQLQDAVKHLLQKKSQSFLLSLSESVMDESDISAAIYSLLTNDHTMGKSVDEFERKFATKVGAKYSVMVSD